MTAPAEPGEVISLVDRVLTMTRTRILNGEYPPGARLRLQMLAEESGASLIPVREALRVLEAERLVETIPNRGARVAELSIEDMEDLYRVRILLETETLRDADPLDADEVKRLDGILDEIKRQIDADDMATVMELHREFHFGLYAATRSQWLSYLVELLWNHTERYQRLALPFRHDGAEQEHRAVLEALATGDNERAVAALRNHLSSTAGIVGAAYRRQEAES